MSRAIHHRSVWSRLISTFLVLTFAFSVTVAGYVADDTDGVSTALADNDKNDANGDDPGNNGVGNANGHDKDKDESVDSSAEPSSTDEPIPAPRTPDKPAPVPAPGKPAPVPAPGKPAPVPAPGKPAPVPEDSAGDSGDDADDKPGRDPFDDSGDDADDKPGRGPFDDSGDDADDGPTIAASVEPDEEVDPFPASATLPFTAATVIVPPSGQGITPIWGDNKASCPVGTTGFKIDATPKNGTYDLPGGGTVTVSNATNYSFDYTTTGVLVQQVIVKASDWAHRYVYNDPGVRGDTGLWSTPKDDGSGFHQISHVSWCFIDDPTAEISGMKWEDLDGNTRWHNGVERLLSGWTIYLERLNPDGSIDWKRETKTDTNGYYKFTDLMPGTYRVTEDESDPDYVRTYGGCQFTVDDKGEITAITLACDNDSPGKFDFGNMPIKGERFRKTFNLAAAGLDTRFGKDVSYYVTFMCDGPKELVLSSSAPHMATMNGLKTGTKISDVYWWAEVGGTRYRLGYQKGPEYIQGSDLLNQHRYTVRVHGHKFGDLNNNGRWDRNGGEKGLAGWTIRLHKADGTFVVETVTDGDGHYEFTGLLPGDYYVLEDPSEKGPQWIQTHGPTMEAPNRFQLRWGETHQRDFGNHERGHGRVYGYKFGDLNGNRCWDREDGEKGLKGWTIRLHKADGTFVAETVTDGDGFYEFTGLPPGDYYVLEDPSEKGPQWVQTYGSTGWTHRFRLGWGEAHRGDFGNREVFGSVHGYKYNDLNNSGGWNLGDEPGINGWTIELYKADGTFIRDTTTGNGGYYEFTGLPAGDYYVDEAQQTGWAQTGGLGGYYFTVGSGGSITLACDDDKPDPPCEVSLRFDFGNRQVCGSIHGYKYNDYDGHGDWDLGDEPGIKGWTIRLTKPDGTFVYTTTGNGGYYEFTGLPAGTYHVDEVQETGWAQTGGKGGYDFTVGSGGTITSACCPDEPDPPCEVSLGFDFGNHKPEFASVRGYKFFDVNHDGDWDINDDEDGLSGWTIELYRVGESVSIATTVTGGNGYYEFTGLEPGNYYVVEVIPDGSDWYQTYGSEGPADAFTLTWGDSRCENFGNCHDYVKTWELEIFDYRVMPAGVKYFVTFTLNGGSLMTVDLLRDGTGIEPMVYSAEMPVEFDDTIADVEWWAFWEGEDIKLGDGDSDDPVEGDLTNSFILESIVFGNKFSDDDADGVWDTDDEDGIEDWEIVLIRLMADGSEKEYGRVFTNASGYYEFRGVLPGEYRLEEVPQDGWAQMASPAGTFSVANFDHKGPYDFGNAELGRIYGFKYMDFAPTGGDPGAEDMVLDGVTIKLYKADGTPVAETVTAADGSFSFEDLLPGSYYVVEVVPDDMTQTAGPKGSGDAFDLSPGGEVGPIYFLNAPPFEPLSPVIFGHKYRDTDGNGWHGAGEPGMGGWTIELYYDSDGVWKRVATKVTGSTGYWEFRALPDGSPLPDGKYYVVEVIPEGSDWKQTYGPRGPENSFTVDDTVQIDYGPFDFGNSDLDPREPLPWMPFTGGDYTTILMFAIVSLLMGVTVRRLGKQMAQG